MNNPNHPKKGQSITVDPIRNKKDIVRIKKNLKSNMRDLLLFTMGINNGLRVSDLLSVRVGDIKHLKVNEYLNIKEKKTGKDNLLMVNKSVHSILGQYLSETTLNGDDFLFKSRKGNQPLSVPSVNRLMKNWCYGLNGNYGSHSLRKTFGYHQRVNFGVSFEILCKRFNHSNPSITMRYLGIQSKEVCEILTNEI